MYTIPPSLDFLGYESHQGRTDSSAGSTLAYVPINLSGSTSDGFADMGASGNLAILGEQLRYFEELQAELDLLLHLREQERRSWTLEEALQTIEVAQSAEIRYVGTYCDKLLFVALVEKAQLVSDFIRFYQRAIAQLKSTLLKLCRATFCGVSWCKRVWFLMHGNRPPHDKEPSIGLYMCWGCAPALS